jgi:hypothetical protein
MTVESATYINTLNPSYPASGGPAGEGDDHIGLIKQVLQNTFPNLSGAMTASHTELNKLDGATISTAELNYLAGVTGGIQAQLDGKEATVSLTASRAVVSGAGGGLAASAVTSTELGYLSGVTSAVQTQITARLIASNNLSDLASAAAARTNLGVTATGVDTTYCFRANNLSDVASAATAFSNIKQAASTSATGVVELATDAELQAGADSARVPSVAALADNVVTIAATTSTGSSIGTSYGIEISDTFTAKGKYLLVTGCGSATATGRNSDPVSISGYLQLYNNTTASVVATGS